MLRVGLEFAHLLRRHFPGFYLDHAMNRRTDPASLFGVAMAFLSLAHTELIALDTANLPHVKPKDPVGCLTPSIVRDNCSYWLRNTLVEWLEHPAPRVYGLGRDTNRLHPVREVGWQAGVQLNYARDMRRHGLALAIWRLVSAGPWAAFADDQLVEYAQQFDAPLMQAIAVSAVPLTPPTPLVALCQTLDRAKPHGVTRLGSIIAFVCARTGNPYADWSQLELGGEAGRAFTLDWRAPREVLREARHQQQRAAQLRGAYNRLDQQVHRNPDLLLQLCQAIRVTAGELLRDPHVDVTQRDVGGTYDPVRLTQNPELV